MQRENTYILYIFTTTLIASEVWIMSIKDEKCPPNINLPCEYGIESTNCLVTPCFMLTPCFKIGRNSLSPMTLSFCLQSYCVPGEAFCPSPPVKVTVNTNTNMGSKNTCQYSNRYHIADSEDAYFLR